MTLEKLVQLLESKLRHLEQQKMAAEQYGDVASVISLEQETTETALLLNTLKTHQ